MSKNVVFCADGTWNGSDSDDNHDGAADPTNVFKLYMNLAGAPTYQWLRKPIAEEQEKEYRGDDGTVLQVAKYLHGVGNSNNFFLRMLGGAFGVQTVQRIVRGYTFISREWQDKDSIYISGFSRGAYTARALGGLIVSQGLLNPALLNKDGKWDTELAYKYGLYAWTKYRERAANKPDNSKRAAKFVEYVATSAAVEPPDGAFLRPQGGIKIKAIGIWDTVGSLGIPIYDPNNANQTLDEFRFADLDLSPNVEWGFHALALEEKRSLFTPTLWNDRENVEQVWFGGAHADVGGGYPSNQSGLSNISLKWMTDKLKDAGLHFVEPWAFPATISVFESCHEPWKDVPFNALPNGPRDLRTLLSNSKLQLRLHESVRDRWDKGTRPAALNNWLSGSPFPGVASFIE